MSQTIRPSIIDPNKSYTFSDYFKLNPPIDEFAQYFGYQYQTQNYQLPQTTIDEAYFASLHQDLNEIFLYVQFTSETARREMLIAPVLLKVVRYLKINMRIEYTLNVTDQLQGKLDYLFQGAESLLVVEAKDADMERGFTQLTAELIALDQWQAEDVSLIYGAVSVGNIWQFGVLDRGAKTMIRDFNLFRVPADLTTLLRILVAILKTES